MQYKALEELESLERALESLPVTEDTRWMLKYLAGQTRMLRKIREFLAGIFIVLLLIAFKLYGFFG